MRISKKLSHCSIVALFTVSAVACRPLPGRIGVHSNSKNKVPAHVSTKTTRRGSVVCNYDKPKDRQSCLQYLKILALQAFLDALWHATYDVPADLAGVVACIYDHESGNPTESSHPWSGSGKAQYIPSTWLTWFGHWHAAVDPHGPWYALAFYAPSYVQDAVLVYTLRNGGASNWSNNYGYDPCTQGMY